MCHFSFCLQNFLDISVWRWKLRSEESIYHYGRCLILGQKYLVMNLSTQNLGFRNAIDGPFFTSFFAILDDFLNWIVPKKKKRIKFLIQVVPQPISQVDSQIHHSIVCAIKSEKKLQFWPLGEFSHDYFIRINHRKFFFLLFVMRAVCHVNININNLKEECLIFDQF